MGAMASKKKAEANWLSVADPAVERLDQPAAASGPSTRPLGGAGGKKGGPKPLLTVRMPDAQEISYTIDADTNDNLHLVRGDFCCDLKTLKASDIQFQSRLGQGNGGLVFKVKHKAAGGVNMAMKQINLGVSGTRSQLITELSMYETFGDDCSNIISFFGAYIKHSSVYIALEYMPGGSLQDVIDIGKHDPSIPSCLSPGELVSVMRDVLQALAFLEKKKVIHRDIKPSNILLTVDGVSKVSDFGTSQLLGSDGASSCEFVGTAMFMSPERITGQDYSFNSDVWSLGLVAYHAATGIVPYATAESQGAIVLAETISQSQPPHLAETSGFSREICDFVAACLSRDRGPRPNASLLMRHPWLSAARSPPAQRVKMVIKKRPVQAQLATPSDFEDSENDTALKSLLGADSVGAGHGANPDLAYFLTFSSISQSRNWSCTLDEHADNDPLWGLPSLSFSTGSSTASELGAGALPLSRAGSRASAAASSPAGKRGSKSAASLLEKMSQGVSARNSESGLDTDFKHVSKPQRDQGRLIKESSVMPEWASDEIPAEEIIKGLHIHELHARSGQADVFRGTFAGHVAGELRQVIAKIPTGSEAKALKTFTTEARIIWELSEPGHVNCVRMVAFIESPRPCLVVPFLSGGSLSDFVRQQGQLSNTRRRELALQITSGLDYIHSRNVAHRDIKSQNILLNEQGCAVIIDFGLAVADQKEDALVLIDRVVGTPPFMAPEIMSLMELADFRRSDVYALGIVLFELASGLSPYGHMSAEWNGLKGSEMNDTLFRFVKGGGRPVLLSSTSELKPIMECCWAQQPADRPTALNLLTQLKQ